MVQKIEYIQEIEAICLCIFDTQDLDEISQVSLYSI
jgi:hypothetical protein